MDFVICQNHGFSGDSSGSNPQVYEGSRSPLPRTRFPSVHVQNGIDVSRFQGKIDWKKVAESGVEFAFIRVALRGTSEGKLLVDDMFENNIKGATENGIQVGVYIYSQALNKEEAEVLNLIRSPSLLLSI